MTVSGSQSTVRVLERVNRLGCSHVLILTHNVHVCSCSSTSSFRTNRRVKKKPHSETCTHLNQSKMSRSVNKSILGRSFISTTGIQFMTFSSYKKHEASETPRHVLRSFQYKPGIEIEEEMKARLPLLQPSDEGKEGGSLSLYLRFQISSPTGLHLLRKTQFVSAPLSIYTRQCTTKKRQKE